MSRIGKKEIAIPTGVTASLNQDELLIKGPKGELRLKIHPHITISMENGIIRVTPLSEKDKSDRALWGTFSKLISNMTQGVTVGFKKQLEINGVGFKANLKGSDLILEVGFSHSVEIKPPAGIKFTVEKNIITIEGFDKQLVGEIAAQIRKKRKPDPYKAKGIKYIDEIVKRKAGKTAAKAAA
ncbi:MAG: 50S ribosomal protein L6 [Patescibacteria group bacterium]|nr:50S ribosomal protein L6 [Patescibacteria group bacterium]